MGATNCPETPRQRMISMMYLVLTAMLALNVSKDILDAFVVVDETLVASNRNAVGKILSDYADLDKQQALQGAEKLRVPLEKAALLKKETDGLVSYIEKLRTDLIEFVDGTSKTKDGKDKTVREIEAKDNVDKPTNYMINMGKAKELKQKILTYKQNVLKIIDNADARAKIDKAMGLNVNATFKKADGQNESWESHNFEGLIAVANVTLLNKTIGEVRNAEALVLKEIISSIGAEDFKFNKVSGRAIPKSQMVFTGDSYEADIIVAAFDSTQTPEVYYKMGVDTLTEAQIGTATKLEGAGGMVKLQIGAGGVGEQRYAGLIKIKTPQGEDRYYGFKDRYMVVKPTATVSADKMNVFYANLQNPVSVSAPVAPEKVKVSFSGCTYTSKGAGQYDVTVPENLIGRTVTVTISADVGGGRVQNLGTNTFRVKRVPNPTSVIGGDIYGGKRSKQEILANPFILAKMEEDFVYDLRWSVNSYTVFFVSRGVEDPPIVCNGGRFNETVMSKIQNAAANTVVRFTNIKASSVAGTRTLRDLTVTIR